MTDRTAPTPAAPADALALWAAEDAPDRAPALEPVRLTADERVVVPFTLAVERVELHYLDGTGYAHCHGGGCLLCRVGKAPETRDLLPVYDPLAGAVAVLPVGPNVRPHALRPQLRPVLERVHDGERVAVGIRRLDGGRFAVAAYPLPAGADDGAAAVADFKARYDAGRVAPRDAYPTVPAADLAARPDVAKLMALKGVPRP